MKRELTEIFEDIEIRRALHIPTDANSAEFEDFMAHSRAIKEEHGSKRFSPVKGHQAILESYGKSEVTVEYLCDDFVDWRGGQILRATVGDGAQAKRLLEHCLEVYNMRPDYLRGVPSKTFSEIPSISSESSDAKRTLHLFTGANHPELGWRENYNIYVNEQRKKSGEGFVRKLLRPIGVFG